MSAAQLESELRSLGMSKLHYALDPLYWPEGVGVIDDLAADVMHIYGAGKSAKLFGMGLKFLFKNGAGFVNCPDPWAAVNANAGQLRLPKSRRLPYIREPYKDKSMDEVKLELNSAQTHTFIIHVLSLVDPLLTTKGREHPSWACMLKHREVLQLCLQHTFEIPRDIEYLSRVQEEEYNKFLQVSVPAMPPCCTCGGAWSQIPRTLPRASPASH